MAKGSVTKKPSNDGQKTADGKFARGNRLGRGRPQGSRNKATLAIEALLDGESDKLTRKAVDLAMKGDTTALRLCLERLCPPRKDRARVIRLANHGDACRCRDGHVRAA